MLTGIGLLAVAGAILIATAVFHMEVKRVYYPQVKWARDQHEGELFAEDAKQVSEWTGLSEWTGCGVSLHEIGELDARNDK